MPSPQRMIGMQKASLMPELANGSFRRQLSPVSAVAHNHIFPEVPSSRLPRKCEYTPLSSWDVCNTTGSSLGHIIGICSAKFGMSSREAMAEHRIVQDN